MKNRTDLLGQIWMTIKHVFKSILRDTKSLLGRMRRKRAKRRQEKAKRKPKYNTGIRRRVLSRALIRLLIFTVIYWGAAYLLYQSQEMVASLLDASSLYFLHDMAVSLYYNETALITIFTVLLLIVALFELSRTAKYIETIHNATGVMLDESRDIDQMPRDIKEVEVALREIKLSITQSRQAAREAEQRKNDLVVYLAHDLKTPLSSVIGYLTLMEESPELNTEQRAKFTSIALDKAYRLEQLINEFFDITRFNLQSVELENNRIDLSLMLEQMADEFYPVMEEKGLSIRLDVQPRLMLIGDADKLARVFDNLLRNAVSYSYEDTEISVGAWQKKNHVEIIFKNTGDEISKQNLSLLFEKFFRLDSARRSSTGGAGLGLAIAKQIVELHGGRISAKSSREATMFRIQLPVKM